MTKTRLDVLLTARGLAETRTRAQAYIMAGRVRSGDRIWSKPGEMIDDDTPLEVEQPETQYVSRGGEKLAHALGAFEVDPRGLVALDVGASTGGFTDVLLRRGVACVYAVDVGYGELAWTLRQDPRVIVLERTNIRYLDRLPRQADGEEALTPALAVIDVSFISLAKILATVAALLTPDGSIVALVKPQFEAGRGRVGKGGIVRDPVVHRQVLNDVLGAAASLGLHAAGLTSSPILGRQGNREFLALWNKESGATPFDQASTIDAMMKDA